MKKFTLFVVFICTVAVSFGQMTRSTKQALAKPDAQMDLNLSTNHIKGAGDIIWQTTFNWGDTTEARGWKKPNGWTVKDNTDLGNTWIWRKAKVGGNYTNITAPPSWFVSKDDGFIVLPMDEYNSLDGTTLENPSDSYIETEMIDCSKVSSVVVQFNQLLRWCCNTDPYFEVLASTDGVHWSSPINCTFGTGYNTYPLPRFQSVEINFTELAAGSPTVRLRFYMHGPTHYFWIIDDLKVVEAFQNNLILEDYWANANIGEDQTIGHVNYWPKSQMGMDDGKGGKMGSYLLKGAILNAGMLDQYTTNINFQITRNGQEILNQNSVNKVFSSLQRDTLVIPSPFLANDYGDYKFKFTAVGDAPDEVPANNKAELSFTVNDTLFHRGDFSTESSESGGGIINGSKSGAIVGAGYDIIAPCEINSIYARFSSVDTAAATQFQMVLFRWGAGDVFTEIMSSEVVDATAAMAGNWQNVELIKDGEAEFLTPGFYVAGVKMMGTSATSADGVSGMSVSVDKDTKFNGWYAYFYRVLEQDWLERDYIPQIGIVINQTGGPTQAPVTFNVDMTKHIANGEFKPGIDVVSVNGLAASWNGTVTLTDPDANGIYSATVAGLKVASVLNYKYAINGTKEAYPLTGDPYRKWTVRYFNNTNDTYNGGVTTGVDPISLVASLSVYPNPAQGAFNVAITNTVPSDLIITLTNIRGQVIYRNSVANVLNHQETIDQKLSKGLYFLSINNGKEIKVQKIIIQ